MANPGVPILNSPIQAVIVNDNTPSLNFTVPSDPDNDNLIFQVELDTNNPINPSSSDYKKFESRLSEGAWQYWKNGEFIDIPTAGLRSTDYGSDAIFTIPNIHRLRNALWYWKVSVSDEMTCVKFNQGIFSQKKFCSGT
jgi:hypothetical protein